MDKEQVRQEINTAFAGLPIPPPRKLIKHRYKRDRAGEERIRRDLAGKTWQELSPAFVQQRWSAFSYLSPEAYRYYLPALLMGALEEFFDTSSLLHSVLFELRPGFWSLYYNGKDHDFEAKQSAFTPPQYRAVCSFLGWAFEATDYRHMAAQALYWKWNRFDTPALKAARDYYRALHTFSYPPPEDPEIADLFREIRSAFAATPYPGDDQLCGSEQGDEPAECAMELRGLRWQSIHPELLACNYTALSFLSEAGFRYFLLAFLLESLSGYDSNADPVFSLTHGFYDDKSLFDETKYDLIKEIVAPEQMEMLKQFAVSANKTDWRAYSTRRFMHFTQRERTAIIHYLEYRMKKDEFGIPDIRQALERYWRPSAQ